MTYRATTREIEVSVEPTYLDDQSDPGQDRYVWAYRVTITNNSTHAATLKTRHWIITNAYGHVHQVKGDGVVGQQPRLVPGDSFTYTSGTPLGTPSGVMVGTYGMLSDAGEAFDIDIPAFSLDSPHETRRAH